MHALSSIRETSLVLRCLKQDPSQPLESLSIFALNEYGSWCVNLKTKFRLVRFSEEISTKSGRISLNQIFLFCKICYVMEWCCRNLGFLLLHLLLPFSTLHRYSSRLLRPSLMLSFPLLFIRPCRGHEEIVELTVTVVPPKF